MPYGTTLVDIIESSGNLSITGNVSTSGNLSVTGNLTTTGTIASATGVTYPLVSGTVQNTTSGTSIDFTSIPSWVKRITIMYSGVSTSGTSNWLVQLGDSGGVENTGYLGVGTFQGVSNGGANYTAGFGFLIGGAGHILHGPVVLTLLSSSTNTWTCMGSLGGTGGAAGYIYSTAGAKSLTGTLDRIRLTTVNGTDTFDAGTVNILYE
jgi:hypothetical protein